MLDSDVFFSQKFVKIYSIGLVWVLLVIKSICMNSIYLPYRCVVVVGGLVAKSCLTLATPWTVARQARLSVRFSRQEYWGGLPFPSPGDLPSLGIKPGSPALQADSFSTEL